MNVIQRMEHWGDAHHPAWLDIVRIALGLLLLGRGISFISDTDQLTSLIGGMKGLNIWTMAAVHYVAFAHLVGGFLIACGIMTRFASAVQIPILFVAVFFINILRGFSYLNSELWLSVVTLALLILYVIVGSGRFSADEYLKHQERKRH
ncbi:MAG: DoxX family protein [Cytophagaceae bacterium]|nr:DoxX family protein [Cytophagaceae bacterium]